MRPAATECNASFVRVRHGAMERMGRGTRRASYASALPPPRRSNREFRTTEQTYERSKRHGEGIFTAKKKKVRGGHRYLHGKFLHEKNGACPSANQMTNPRTTLDKRERLRYKKKLPPKRKKTTPQKTIPPTPPPIILPKPQNDTKKRIMKT